MPTLKASIEARATMLEQLEAPPDKKQSFADVSARW